MKVHNRAIVIYAFCYYQSSESIKLSPKLKYLHVMWVGAFISLLIVFLYFESINNNFKCSLFSIGGSLVIMLMYKLLPFRNLFRWSLPETGITSNPLVTIFTLR